MIKPHIILDPINVSVIMPFNMKAKTELKDRIPFEQRRWDPSGKAWRLSSTEENFKIAREIIKKHFNINPPIFNKGGDLHATFDVAINTSSYYTVLQVKEDSTQEEIKKGHRKLIMKVHPDRGGDAEHFRLIQLAYETLSNVKKRKRYDLARGLVYNKVVNPSPKASFHNPFSQSGVTGSVFNVPYPSQPPPPTRFHVGYRVGQYVHWQGSVQQAMYKIRSIDTVADGVELQAVNSFGDPVLGGVTRAPCRDITLTSLPPPNFKQGSILSWNGKVAKFRKTVGSGSTVRVFPDFADSSSFVATKELRYFPSYPSQLFQFPLHFEQGDFVSIPNQSHLTPAIFVKKVGDTGMAMIDTPMAANKPFTPGRKSNLGTIDFKELDYYVPKS